MDGLFIDFEGCNMLNLFFLIFKLYRNVIIGNYDVNVLIFVFNFRNKEVVWFDWCNGVEILFIEIVDYGDRLLGIIVNIFIRKWLGMW